MAFVEAFDQLPQFAALVTVFIPFAIGCIGYFLKGEWHTVKNRKDVPAGAEQITELKDGTFMGTFNIGGAKIRFYHTCKKGAPKNDRGFGFTAQPAIK
jgi:hypothetical protein